MEFKYACEVPNERGWYFEEEKKKEPFWKDLPQKKQTHTLTQEDIKKWTKPWNKEKEKVNGKEV